MSAGTRTENSRLKIVGLLLIALGLAGYGYLSDRTDWQPFADGLRSGQLPRRALLFVVAGNAFALGVLALVAGFRDHPPISRAAVRRSVLIMMLGANLVIVFAGLLGLNEVGVFGDTDARPWILLPGVIVLAVMTRIGVLLLRRGSKYYAVPADELLRRDPRPPVVYVRSFADDDAIVVGSWYQRLLTWLVGYMHAISAEQELAMILRRVGPVVAIGKPGETLPELGAARLYAADDEWREVVTDLMRRARLVVVRAGSTPNLQWEIDRAATLLPLERLLVVSFARGRQASHGFDEDIARRFGARPVPDPPPARPIVAWVFGPMRVGTPAGTPRWRIVYFDSESKPHAVPVGFAMSWTGFFSVGTRPYRDPLNAAFRLVFARLDIPWIGTKTRTWAALLALFLGSFGAHHFYLGNRRRALWYLAFCWTLVPLLLSLRDAIRFTLAEQHEFESRFVATHRSP